VNVRPLPLAVPLDEALGPLGEGLNAGHIYVTLGRLERTGMVALEEAPRAVLSNPTGRSTT
jgi:hypothetical protein